jgi:hypothetical protein
MQGQLEIPQRAGDRDRTGDVQLGKMSLTFSVTHKRCNTPTPLPRLPGIAFLSCYQQLTTMDWD